MMFKNYFKASENYWSKRDWGRKILEQIHAERKTDILKALPLWGHLFADSGQE